MAELDIVLNVTNFCPVKVVNEITVNVLKTCEFNKRLTPLKYFCLNEEDINCFWVNYVQEKFRCYFKNTL